MDLDETISEWTEKHYDQVTGMIGIAAFRYRQQLEGDFPSDVMAIGENWIYVAELINQHGPAVQLGNALVADLRY